MYVITVSSRVHIACILDELINSTKKLKFELISRPRNKHKHIVWTVYIIRYLIIKKSSYIPYTLLSWSSFFFYHAISESSMVALSM